MLAGFAITKVAAFITALQAVIKVVNTLRNSSLAAAVAEMFMINPLGGAVMAAAMIATIAGVIKSVDILTDKANKAKDALSGVTTPTNDGSDRGGAAKYAEGAAARAAKDAKDAAAAQLKATKAQTKALQDQNKLKKSQGILDVDQANIIAALQGKLSENEKLRLELQLALLTGNAKEADRLSNALLLSQAQTTELASWIMKLPKALNPFADYPAYVLAALAEMDKMKKGITDLTNPPTTSSVPYVGSPQEIANAIKISNAQGSRIQQEMMNPESGYYNATLFGSSGGGDTTIVNNTYNLNGATPDLISQLQNDLINQSASGSQSRLNRLALMD
jgi:hypothetical protein